MAFYPAVLCVLGFFSILLRIESSTPVDRRVGLGQRAHGSEGCGSARLSVGASPAVFTSPGYPDFYPANTTCSWRLVAAAGQRINITSNFINLEHSAGCVFDHLIIFDGDSELAQTLGRFCGITPVSVITSSNIALVKLESDRSYTGVGFELSYTANPSPTKTQRVTRPEYCNSTFLTSPGIFTSPNFPLPADINTYCQYTFKAPEGKHVELVFNFFHLEQSTSCQFDNIVIYDGPNKESFLIDRYCGHLQPPLVRSSERDLFLTHTTDSLYSRGGFNVSYQFVSAEQDPLRLTEGHDDCSKLIESEGPLSSPGYPDFYPDNKICIYVLRAPQNQFVQITFDDFKMEMSDRCSFDYLAIYDGLSRELLASYEFCGEQVIPGTSFTSKGREYTLKFRSDHSVSDIGFLLNITFVSHTAATACSLQCENQGACVQQQLGPICDCVPPHIGDRCQIAPSDCGSGPCLNGGTCQSNGDSYICHCPDGLKGDNCQFDDTELLEFVAPIGNRTVSLRDDPILECRVNRGYAHIEWVFDDDIYLRKDSPENRRRSIRVYEGGLLHMLEVGPLNAGKYTCVAVDGAERIEQVAYVIVDEPCEFEVTYKPANATETIGKRTHLLKCLAKGGTSSGGRLTYTWFKDDLQLPKTDSYRVLSNHFLQISNLDFADAGKYTCKIKDTKCEKRYTAFLTVVGKTNLNNICGRPTMSFPGRIQRTARIVGGLPALDGSYPWFALLVDTVDGRSFCGASIIDSRWIVTAAHCLGAYRHGTLTPIYSPHTTKIFVGTTNCRGDGGVPFPIDRAVIHEAYEQITLDNDIALIRLKEVIKFTPTVQPICLESKSFNEDEFFRKHAAGYVAGCGLLKPNIHSPARQLREVKLPIQSRSVCLKSLTHDSVMTESMFCAGFSTASRGDACRGDSGGGFVVQSGERFVLVGVVSWGIGCDAEGQYGFYTHVGRFFNWIHKYID